MAKSDLLKAECQIFQQMIVGLTRDVDAAGLGDAFKPRRDVHTITENIVSIDNDIADIDSNAEFDSFVSGHVSVALDHAALHFDGAAHRVNNGREFNKHSVAGCFHNATTVF